MHRTRYKIPDYPIDRPKIPEVLKLVREHYQKPENIIGGQLHAIFENNNYNIGFLTWLKEEIDLNESYIINKMLQMTPTQRRKVIASR